MSNRVYQVGATSKIVTLRAITISTGLPYTAGAFNTATISATYTRDGAAPTPITLVTATAGTYTSSGFVHRGKGVYELGAPAAALLTGVDGVEFAVDGIADVLFTTTRVDLTAQDLRAAAGTVVLTDASLTSAKFSAGAIDANALNADAVTEIVDALLKRDLSAVTGEAARSLLNAIRFIRNKRSVSGATLTVTKEDDVTAAWTATIVGTAGVTSVDPA